MELLHAQAIPLPTNTSYSLTDTDQKKLFPYLPKDHALGVRNNMRWYFISS